MPIQIFYEIADDFLAQNKTILVKQLIMNLEFFPDEVEILMDYCLDNKLYIAMVSLGINSVPPQFGKLLNVLMNKMQNQGKEMNSLSLESKLE